MDEITTKKCPQCQMDVPALAKKCPHCRSKLPQPTSTLTKIFAVVLGVGIVSSMILSNSSDPVPAPVYESSVSVQSAVFDVPTLLGMTLKELTTELGTPSDDSEPTRQQIELGTPTWEKSWEKDGYFLMATYDVSTRDIVDLFLGSNTDIGFIAFRDTNNILKVGNLTTSDSTYSVEFVKARNAEGYTGAIVKEK